MDTKSNDLPKYYGLSLIFAEKENITDARALRNVSELMEDMLPGGIIGGYMEPGFPLYVISEKMIKLMGFDDYDDLVAFSGGMVSNLMHPDDRQRVNEQVDETLKNADEYDVSYRQLKKDGSFFWVRDKGHRIFTGDGRDAIVSVLIDITEQKIAENQMIEERKQLELQLKTEQENEHDMESQYMGVMRFNLTKNLLEKRTNYYDASGGLPTYPNMTMEEYLDTIRPFFFSREEEEHYCNTVCVENLTRQYYADNLMFRFRQSHRMPTGLGIWLEYSVRLRRNPVTEDLLAFISIQDVTKEELMQTMIQQASFIEFDYIVAVDTVTGKYVLYSDVLQDKAVSFDGIYTDDYMELFANKSAGETLDVKDALAFSTIINALKESGSYEVRLDGSMQGEILKKQFKVFWHPIASNYFIIVGVDITETVKADLENQKKIEQALARAEKANQAKTEFLARMSHDMRTPMNGIKGMTALALLSDDIDEIKDYLRKVELSGELLLRLINDVLDTAKIERNQLVLTYEPYSVTEFMALMEVFLKPQCEEKHIKYTIQGDKRKDVAILTDKTRLNQIFMNLLSNAVKFTPDGGEVSFKTEIIEETSTHITYRDYITDSGIGMTEEYMEHLFEPFSRESRQGYEQIPGTGLGLSITKGLVQALGGTLSVKSKVNQGTQFVLEFTMEKCEPVGRGQENIPPASLKGKHILLCEDNDINAQIAVKLLEMKGMLTDRARNGAEGLAMFEQSTVGYYDVILMDVRMPVMDGITTAKRIRFLGRPDAKSVPIIAMTANAFEDDRKQTKEAGMNAHLSKPIDPQMLYTVIEQYLSSVS